MSTYLKTQLVAIIAALLSVMPVFCGVFDALCKTGNVPAFATPSKITVNGVVKDSNGDPVIGASIVEKGTRNGTTTDINGMFTIQVDADAILVVSSIGYTDQEIAAAESLSILLAENAEYLDSVVVVGFGSQKKVNLTGSVGVATGDDLKERPVTNAVQALQGLVPGLNISTTTGELDQTMSISVRGKGTIGEGSSGSPLILIDGMEGDINLVNPQDIESISVLKDAAASSIYGSRAPFGVILITTKSGAKGGSSVNYNNSFRFSSPINIPKSMDSYTFAVFMNQAQINSGNSAYYTDETMRKMLDYQAGTLTGGIDASSPTTWKSEWTDGYANTDLYAETYKSLVFSQEHNVSLSGGNDRITYYASANYLRQGGTLKIADDGLNRYNFTAKFNARITDWLSININARYNNQDVWVPSAGMSYNYYGRQNWPNIPMYDPNGYMFCDRALQIAEGGTKHTFTSQHYYQAGLTFEPVKNWITKAELNYSKSDVAVKSVTLPVYRHDPSGNKYTGTASSTLSNSNTDQDYLNLNIYSEYSFSLSNAHNFKTMAGFQAEHMKQGYLYVRKYGLLDYNLPEFDLTTGLNGAGSTVAPSVNGSDNEWKTVGFFGRLNYNYKEKYLFEVNVRYDGTSRFRAGSRWVFSPSLSLGWNIAREDFWSNARKVVNQLKVRASVGQLSNQNTTSWYPTYRTMTLSSASGGWLDYNGTKPNVSSVGPLVSNTLTWERVRTWNAGLDWGLFDNRFTGSFDYFTRYTVDMVGPAPELPATLGIASPKQNNTSLHTSGWELSLSWKDRIGKEFNYGIILSLSDQNTYIDYYPGNSTNSIGANAGSAYITGQKLGLIWGYETIGIAKSQAEMDAHLASLPNGGQSALGSQWAAGDIMYRDINGDGKISAGSRTLDDHGDLIVLGDANPHYFFSIDLTASWKNFDLRCYFQGLLDYDYWPGGDSTTNNEGAGGYFWGARGNRSLWHTRGFTAHEDYFRAESIGLPGHEIAANLDSYYPRPVYDGKGKNQVVQSRYMQNARYLRLKNLQLGYTLPQSICQNSFIGSARVYVSGENLLTFTPLSDLFDPETAFGGIGGNAYPLSRTFSVGVSLTF